MLINRLKGDKKFVYINIVMIIMTVTLLGIGFFKVSFHQVSKYVDYTVNWYSNGEKVDLSKVEDYEYIEMEIPEIHKDTFLFFCAKSVNLNIFVNKLVIACSIIFISLSKSPFLVASLLLELSLLLILFFLLREASFLMQ